MSSAAAADRKKRRRREINNDDDNDCAVSSSIMDTTTCVAVDGAETSTTIRRTDAGSESTNPYRTDDENDIINNDAFTPVQSEKVILALQRLDDEYSRLSTKEKQIEQYLATLQHEEVALRHALELTSTSLKEQRISEKKRKEEEALSRLEEALMMDHDYSSEDEDDT